MIDLTAALAAQILVSIVLGALIGGGLSLAGVSLFKKSADRRDRRLRRDEIRQRAVRDDEDEIHDDSEHMRVVREHGFAANRIGGKP